MVDTPSPALNVAAPAVFRLELEERHPNRASLTSAEDWEWTEPLLKRNAVWFCQLRWIVITVLALAGGATVVPPVASALGLERSPAWPLAAAAALTVLNLFFAAWPRQAGAAVKPQSVRMLLWAQIISDLLVLTAVLYWIGHQVPGA